jgi:hypothetical protein
MLDCGPHSSRPAPPLIPRTPPTVRPFSSSRHLQVIQKTGLFAPFVVRLRNPAFDVSISDVRQRDPDHFKNFFSWRAWRLGGSTLCTAHCFPKNCYLSRYTCSHTFFFPVWHPPCFLSFDASLRPPSGVGTPQKSTQSTLAETSCTATSTTRTTINPPQSKISSPPLFADQSTSPASRSDDGTLLP